MRVLVTGGTGFIGRRLLGVLARPIVLTRAPERAAGLPPGTEVRTWDPAGGPPPEEAFDGAEGIVHLAGEPVAAARWTRAVKERIRNSRVAGTRHLVAGIAAARRRPRVLVSASAIGIYGDRGNEILDESSAPGADFLSTVCRDWEAEAARAEAWGVRVVRLRIGIVLGAGGGALAKMLPPFRLGLGGPLGSGQQWMSWIHLDDLVGLVHHVLATETASGPVNAVSPESVTNRDFARALGTVLRRPAVLPVPAFALRLGLGEFAAILLASQRVRPAAALRLGYVFRHADLPAALRDTLD